METQDSAHLQILYGFASDFRDIWFFSFSFIWSFYGHFSEGLHLYLHSPYHSKPNTSHTPPPTYTSHIHNLHTQHICLTPHTHTHITLHTCSYIPSTYHTHNLLQTKDLGFKDGGKMNCAEFKLCLGHDLMSLGRQNYLPALILKQERGFHFI